MLDLLKNIYIFDVEMMGDCLEKLWNRYQDILSKEDCSWEEINEARAILYYLGHIFTEHIALESLERRIKFVEPEISIDDFLLAIDSNNEKILSIYKEDDKFNKLKNFYLLVKGIKNRVNQDGTYLDEETFNKKYDKLRPDDYF
ncbi:hypothetical protein A2331_03980 [Candidatus Falkowbacteria bacterium RIFOXYB2_FULL_34_18]|uniref:Uncharacterized protein n=1 Tax=Candidatus Falkowbacteria bacterium RIFOXYD2_FULL_34_120 TaxID=1798007 RepID=A0A1F5TPB7_9BACT|nr:MAG: hypothetical protein A2331_03980 [Candidatus Falkowbacteria bacterium RIFOXYB2_FULL_34_18]OGF29110.1 MAG: hypothetical protein A2500_03305 [Candidatus Falkowbacteria bacterium RIFOXYC12_FULL_34_55]OGF36193.1 MAG: hypothetical protein A2466_04835 [Candidatus Falkowbacteria bacterium RIFOXYC2_FULL_34_220]OGF38620.1 MAG: hypothetical protein A2515_02195 [Candidatus Falkowbacteria bacterium RIFOXYD12_FULL_34_57]OGF40803.1 MAG: hypothetical protein A2531_06840 [Candidatus Falkowbacteria bact